MKASHRVVFGMAVNAIVVVGAASAAVVHVDPQGLTGTVLIDNFEDGALNAGITSAEQTEYSLSESSGKLTGTVPANKNDPSFHLNAASVLDASQYPYLRVGGRFSTDSGKVMQIFYYNSSGEGISGSRALNFPKADGNAYFDQHGEMNTDEITQVNRYRVDPLYILDQNVTFELHYLMADKTPTQAIAEFDAADDTNDLQITNATVNSVDKDGDSLLTMMTTSSDPKIYTTSSDIDTNLYNALEIRFKVAANAGLADAQIFWGSSSFSADRSANIPTVKDGQFHTYLIDMSDESSWTGTIKALRFDPLGNSGQPVEVDYIRAVHVAPEPATLGLLLLGGTLLLSRPEHKSPSHAS